MIDFKEIIAEKISNETGLNKQEIKQYIEVPPNNDLVD